MGSPLDALNHQLQHLVFTVFIPLSILAMIVGIALREGAERLALAIVRFLRGKRAPVQRERGQAASRDDGKAAEAKDRENDNAGVTAPCCPKCRRQMVKRKARRGAKSGSLFWGCPAFPDCNGTRSAD